MRKTQLALAAVALMASTAAMAQVTMYGAVDTSVVGGSGIKANMDGTGNWNGSIYGFKGSEDLGNGMKAGFALEAGFSGATGSMANGGQASVVGTSTTSTSDPLVSRVFNRQANVFVGGDFGTVKLGLQLSPFIAGSLGGYVNNNESFYVPALQMASTGALSATTAEGLAGNGITGSGGFFVPNAVSYSVTAGGVSASVLGQLSNGTAAGEYTAGTVGTSFGDVSVNASYHNRGGTTGYTGYNLNAKTTVNGLTIGGGYTSTDPAAVGTATVTAYQVGVSYPVTESLVGSVQYASGTGSQNLANIGLQYNLSKSTYLYTTIAQGKNRYGVLYSGGPDATTASKTGYAIGVVTNF
jgi:predicted porin